jgi:hypothetical protein
MRNLLALVFVSFALAGCFHETVERQPVIVSPPASNTVVVPGHTVVCPAGSVC